MPNYLWSSRFDLSIWLSFSFFSAFKCFAIYMKRHTLSIFLKADEQKLRLLELNSWQLLRLLQVHFTELGCGSFSCESGSGKNSDAERFCCSYEVATALHQSWISKNLSRLFI